MVHSGPVSHRANAAPVRETVCVCVCLCVSGALAISDITVGEIFGSDVPDTLQRASDMVSSKPEAVCLSLLANLRKRDLLVSPLSFHEKSCGFVEGCLLGYKIIQCQCMYLSKLLAGTEDLLGNGKAMKFDILPLLTDFL